MRKKVLILAHYCGDLDGRLSNRFVYLASLLSNNNEVELVTSNFYHTRKTKKQVTGEYSFRITLIDEPPYASNIGFQRLVSHWKFSRKVKAYIENTGRIPDIIYASFPSISLAQVAADYSIKNSIPLFIDVQDLWPEAFKKQLLRFKLSKLIYNFLERRTTAIFNRSSLLVSVSNSFVRDLSLRATIKSSNVTYIGAKWDSKPITSNTEAKDRLPIKIVYLGSLGDSYDLEMVIDAFFEVKKQVEHDVELIVIGDGEKKADLEAHARSLGNGVSFTGLIPHQEVQQILPTMDIAVNPIVPWSVASIINKHADYALAGLPVINTQKSLEYRELLENYNCGININHDRFDLAEAIIKLSEADELRQNMSLNAFKLAQDKFDRTQTYPALVEQIESYLK